MRDGHAGQQMARHMAGRESRCQTVRATEDRPALVKTGPHAHSHTLPLINFPVDAVQPQFLQVHTRRFHTSNTGAILTRHLPNSPLDTMFGLLSSITWKARPYHGLPRKAGRALPAPLLS